MFCSNHHIGNDMLSSKKDKFVLINWGCSVVVLFTLPYLFTSPDATLRNAECAADGFANSTEGITICVGNDNNFSSLLGFTSVSYLVGYFGLLMAMNDQELKESRGA